MSTTPALRLEYRKAADLPPNPRNWRTHPPAQLAALREALGRVGWAGALLYNERSGRLIDGHARRELAAPDEELPTLVGSWDDGDEAFILATLDPVAAMAEADKERLKDLLAEVGEGAGDAVRALLEDLAGKHKVEFFASNGLTDPDEAPPLPEEPISQLGDVWQLGEHRLLVGDATNGADHERLMAGSVAQLVVTDPPYGVAIVGGNHADRRRIGLTLKNDEEEGAIALWERSFRACWIEGDLYLFMPSGPSNAVLRSAVMKAGVEHRQWLIWVKSSQVMGQSHYHYRHEHIFYGWRGKSSWQGSRTEDSVWEADRPLASPDHPTIKPIVLMERAIKNSSAAGDIVLDPFLGSGTTLIAAERLGRRCYAMEIDPRYVDVAVRRWEEFTGRKAERVPAT